MFFTNTKTFICPQSCLLLLTVRSASVRSGTEWWCRHINKHMKKAATALQLTINNTQARGYRWHTDHRASSAAWTQNLSRERHTNQPPCQNYVNLDVTPCTMLIAYQMCDCVWIFPFYSSFMIGRSYEYLSVSHIVICLKK